MDTDEHRWRREDDGRRHCPACSCLKNLCLSVSICGFDSFLINKSASTWAVRGAGVHGVSMDAKSSSCSCERTCPDRRENNGVLQTDFPLWRPSGGCRRSFPRRTQSTGQAGLAPPAGQDGGSRSLRARPIDVSVFGGRSGPRRDIGSNRRSGCAFRFSPNSSNRLSHRKVLRFRHSRASRHRSSGIHAREHGCRGTEEPV